MPATRSQFERLGRHKTMSAGVVVALAILAVLLLSPRVLRAQQPAPPPAPTNDQNPAADTNNPDNSAPQDNSTPSDLPPPLVSAETGQGIDPGGISRIHWGHLSLFSVNLSALQDDVTAGPSFHENETAGVIKAFILYSFKHGREELDFQYLPQVVFSSTGTSSNLGNQASEFHTFRHLSGRWSMNISDSFSYQPAGGYTQDPTILPDFLNGGVRQNPFLTPSQGFLNNLVQTTLTYNRSQKDHINFIGHYGFLRVTGGPGSNPALPSPPTTNVQTGNDNLVGGGVELAHSFTPANVVGISGNYDHRFLAGGGSDNFYTLLATYRRRLTNTVSFSGSIGPTLMLESIPATVGSRNDHSFTYEGSLTLTKAFGRSGLALSLDRDNISTQYLEGTLTDRLSLSYSRQFGIRWTTTVGGGYIRQQFTGGTGPFVYDGRTAWVQGGYQLFREWSLSGSYTRFTDTGLQGQLPEQRNLFVAGVRWAWAPHDASRHMPKPAMSSY